MNAPQPEGRMASHSGRRKFLATLGGAVAAWPLATRAQQAERVRRIAVLSSLAADDPETQARHAAFLQGLQQWGWTTGRNVQIDSRRSGFHASLDGMRDEQARGVAADQGGG